MSEDGSQDGFRWDFAMVLLVTAIVVLLLWLTSELWLPHHPGRPD
ncbi:MAG TPA: hypothetical protein VK595_15800 [Vicinamibacterales bacterium]|jgi:hypothetical protein|nr:hypothetical protein [Vicinamibacterales bacterium]